MATECGMPITEKEYFVFEREMYPVVTIYDEEDAEEAVRVLRETEKMAKACGFSSRTSIFWTARSNG